jgi:TolA-binding protein
MSDPRRLLGGDASDFEKELLRSWDAEQPSPAARGRVLAAIGVGAGVATAAAAKVGAAAGSSIAPKAAATVGGLAVAKWAALAIGVLAVGGATVGYVRHSAQVREQRATTVALAPSALPAPPTVDRAVAQADAPDGNAVSPSVRSPLAPPVPVEATRVLSSPRTRTAPRAPSGLGEQVSALDSARRELAAGDAPSAVRQLDDYEARFPNGALVEEAEVLRVQALLAEGDRAGASRAGDRFLSAHPDSPHAARIRALLASP